MWALSQIFFFIVQLVFIYIFWGLSNNKANEETEENENDYSKEAEVFTGSFLLEN